MQELIRQAARRIGIGATFLAICLAVGLGSPGTKPQLRADETPGWTIAALSGEARVLSAGSSAWVPGAVGMLLPVGSSLRTGEAGTASLTMGGDRIDVTPSSEVTLAEADPSAGILTRILQHVGTLFFKIAHRPSGTFRVDTPYLAVVVKGTEFGVSVTGNGASVSVSQGTVSVSRSEGGPATSVTAGQKATTASEPGAPVSVSTDSSSAASGGSATGGGTASSGSGSSGDSSSGDSSGTTGGAVGGAVGGLGGTVGGALGGVGGALGGVGGALGGVGGALGGRGI